MPILTIIRPEIPASGKDDFLAAWPTLSADLQAQPGVLYAIGGQVVGENGKKVDDFKFTQYIAFNNAEDEETFVNSAYAQEHKANLKAQGVPEPPVRRFEFAEFSGNSPKPYLQVTSLTLPDESGRQAAREAWTKVTSALGKETNGGKLLQDGTFTGIATIGWDSPEEVEKAYKDPKVVEAFEAYKSLGDVRSNLVKLL
ncbi:hypothetical protein NM208_g7602 [Fusarium decemcellulare]|uniref:Uncharacterized protein n=1 Tax=Fusarium decemcellulare TaxID=57161 RepID=A0ACC1S8F0_9HYPO|nr:hypothetical protein NM208_g7602 [Fusarium decemcellulare]